MNRNRATEDQLRAALHTVADDVQPESPQYRAMLGRYRRREQRRRLLLAAVVTVVFAASVLVALWIINRSSTNTTFYSPGASAAFRVPVQTRCSFAAETAPSCTSAPLALGVHGEASFDITLGIAFG